jgi:DNA replicative helicase MCM subunit Mcm2 (Cdc46/Mcm family)
MDAPRRELFRRFKNFLKHTTDKNGARVYERRIRDMAGQNGESLLVSYSDICNFDSEMVLFLTDAPTETLEIFDAAAKEVVLHHFPGMSCHHWIHPSWLRPALTQPPVSCFTQHASSKTQSTQKFVRKFTFV